MLWLYYGCTKRKTCESFISFAGRAEVMSDTHGSNGCTKYGFEEMESVAAAPKHIGEGREHDRPERRSRLLFIRCSHFIECPPHVRR